MTVIAGISVTGCQAPLALLERVTYAREELVGRLPGLSHASGARQLVLLSTCQRTELYGVWPTLADPESLVGALAEDREVPCAELNAATTRLLDVDAARHLMRVTAGLESFVMGETEIAGQVRWAAQASHDAGTGGLELDRLMAAAVSASRRVQRSTAFAASRRSVATAAVDEAAARYGGSLAGREVLIVGAGEVATTAAARAGACGAGVTVCNRTRRHTAHFAEAGVTVLDWTELADALSRVDVAIMGTTAPHPLVDVASVRAWGSERDSRLLLMDLCLPRNVDPAVRDLDGVSLVDLADLRAAGSRGATLLTEDIAAAAEGIEAELVRYQNWLVSRSVSSGVRQLQAAAQDVAQQEIERLAGRVSPEMRAVFEESVHRIARRLAHGPTRAMVDAGHAGDEHLVDVLSGLFDSTTGEVSPVKLDSAANDPHATTGVARAALHAKRRQVGAVQDAGHQGGVHAAHKIAV